LPKKIIHELGGESCCQYKEETKVARILDIAYKEFSSNWKKAADISNSWECRGSILILLRGQDQGSMEK
jgi:hypothetical protein